MLSLVDKNPLMESNPPKLKNNTQEAVELLGLSSSDSLDSPSFTHFQAPKQKRKVRFKKPFRSSSRNSKSNRNSATKNCKCNCVDSFKILSYIFLLAVVGGLLWYIMTLSTRVQELQAKFADSNTNAEPIQLSVFSVLTASNVESSAAKLVDVQQQVRQQYKRMKKRKELDALVPNGKAAGCKRKKASSGGGGSCSAHELLRHDTDSSDMEDFSILQPRRKGRKKHGSRLCITSVCLSLCQFILVTTSCLVSGALIWLHIGLREDIDLLRTHLQKVEAGNRNTPEALHVIHSSLKQLDSNVTLLYLEVRKNVAEIDNITREVTLLKGAVTNIKESIAAAPAIQQLPKDVHALSESVANFGSKMNALESNVKELKDQQSNIQTSAQTLSGELENLKASLQEFTNATELQIKSSNMTMKDSKFQNILKAANQHIDLLQGQLNDVVSSIGVINATCNSYRELPAKVDTINDAIIWINNSTTSQTTRLSSLENFVLTNLTLRLEQSEPVKALSFQSSGRPDVDDYVNRTVSEVIMHLINQDIFHKDIQIESTDSLHSVEQCHDVLMLFAALLRKFDQIPKAYILNNKNATDLVERMLQDSFEKMVASRDIKIENMGQEIRNLSLYIPTSHNHDSESGHLSDVTTPVLVQSTYKTEKLSPNDEQLKNVLA